MKSNTILFISFLLIILFSSNVLGVEKEEANVRDYFDSSAIGFGFGVTSLYQTNARGGLSTNNQDGRYTGRYDLDLSLDLEKLIGIEGGTIFLHGWGGWPDTKGIDEKMVGSAFGINALSVGNRSMDIVELFYEGPLFYDNLTLTIGKLDFTGIFDASEYADDECSQFLNTSLVDDPTIPFPEQGLGFTLNWNITDSWYLLAGVADAEADGRETGFHTAFCKEDYFFYAVETGKTLELKSNNGSMPGTYRVGFWIDDQDKEKFSDGRIRRNDTGLYTSLNQMLYKENDNAEDSQGLGCFARYGWADSEYNSITNFFSVGLQYQGIFANRDEDVCGFGYSRGFFSNKDALNYVQDYESVLESYYNLHISSSLVISPSMQYITNPSNGEGVNISDTLVLGLRLNMMF